MSARTFTLDEIRAALIDTPQPSLSKRQWDAFQSALLAAKPEEPCGGCAKVARHPGEGYRCGRHDRFCCDVKDGQPHLESCSPAAKPEAKTCASSCWQASGFGPGGCSPACHRAGRPLNPAPAASPPALAFPEKFAEFVTENMKLREQNDRAKAVPRDAAKVHVCKCENGKCPACGGKGPEGEWSEGSDVKCVDCGAELIVDCITECLGRSTFSLGSQYADEDADATSPEGAAAVGQPGIPEGWKPGEGWASIDDIDADWCDHGAHDAKTAFETKDGAMACLDHAKESGAIVPAEPSRPTSPPLRNGWTVATVDRSNCHQCKTTLGPETSMLRSNTGVLFCTTCAVELGALAVDIEPSRPVTGEAVDWSRFVPTGPVDDDGLRPREGDVFIGWSRGGSGSVFRSRGEDTPVLLAGRDDDTSRRIRRVRHADGRWAAGYGPDGPITPLAAGNHPGTALTPEQGRVAWDALYGPSKPDEVACRYCDEGLPLDGNFHIVHLVGGMRSDAQCMKTAASFRFEAPLAGVSTSSAVVDAVDMVNRALADLAGMTGNRDEWKYKAEVATQLYSEAMGQLATRDARIAGLEAEVQRWKVGTQFVGDHNAAVAAAVLEERERACFWFDEWLAGRCDLRSARDQVGSGTPAPTKED